MKHMPSTSPALAGRTLTPNRLSYHLLAPVRILRRELGLTPNDLAVLTALISFLPRDKNDHTSATDTSLTIVFPSNEALSERTNGLNERTIRRCIARLCEADLISRRTSANGKRFPLRFGGMIRDAFGFDLLPLAQQHAALTERASQVTETRQSLKSLRAKALSLRVAALQQDGLTEEQRAKIVAARNILRRATLTVEETSKLIAALQHLVHDGEPKDNAPTDPKICNGETQHMSGKNGQNVRHIESTKKEFKRLGGPTSTSLSHAPSMNSNPALMGWEEFTHVASFYPYPPTTADSLIRTLLDIGKLLGITQERLFRALKTSGPGRMLLAFNYLLARAEDIRHPGSYFDKMVGACCP